MEKIFTLKNYKIASLIFAFLFLFFSVFKVIDISKLAIEILPRPYIIGLCIGAILLILSLFLYLEIGIDLFSLSRIKISKLKNDGICTEIGKTNLTIHFDKLEDISKAENSVVVLPANEYFDDECIKDCKSVLGCYIDKYFRNQLDQFQTLVNEKLNHSGYESTLQKKKQGDTEQKSYGIGSCVFLNKPLNSTERILLIAVTEQRAGVGLYSNISFVYKAVNEIYKKVVDNRIKNIYIPLLGSGHGGLYKRIALLTLITSFTELLKKDNGDKIDNIKIIIYKNGKHQDIPNRVARKILSFGVGLAISKDKAKTKED
jgi:O-acetyl-ADP-ribose deacetylase (regulator of RNase III)